MHRPGVTPKSPSAAIRSVVPKSAHGDSGRYGPFARAVRRLATAASYRSEATGVAVLLIARFSGDVAELTRAYDRAHAMIMAAGGAAVRRRPSALTVSPDGGAYVSRYRDRGHVNDSGHGGGCRSVGYRPRHRPEALTGSADAFECPPRILQAALATAHCRRQLVAQAGHVLWTVIGRWAVGLRAFPLHDRKCMDNARATRALAQQLRLTSARRTSYSCSGWPGTPRTAASCGGSAG
jgi:hypothetical protein